MAAVPRTRYARAGDVHVAFQVFGEGPLDLVVVPGWVSHVEVIWEEPQAAAFLRRLADFARVIMFDKRGTGMSDPLFHAPALDERLEDVTAVMDAAGCERAALLGYSEGGPLALMFAATYPARTTAVMPYGSYARIMRADDYPEGMTEKIAEMFFEGVKRAGDTGELYDVVVPSRSGDLQFRDWFARITRLSASPQMLVHYFKANMSIDVRSLLGSVRAPALVLHRVGDNLVRVGHGRYLAAHIPGARYVELDGGDHWPWFGDADSVVEEIEEFLTGMRHAPSTDRTLATVLFTDIVDSTGHVKRVGDTAWRRTLDAHDDVVRRQVERFRGRIAKQTGDGVLATFDGPARATQCAVSLLDATRAIGLEVRAAIHVGECETRGDDVAGVAVHLCARILDKARAGEVLTSATVRDLVTGSGFRFEDRGRHVLKGFDEPFHLYAVSL
jgi:class 3 adenylate cyclase